MPTPQSSSHWSDSDDFWEKTYPFDFDQDRYAIAPDEVDGITDLLDLVPPAKILDVCCGPGRHSVELARKGYTVTGIDRTAAYLDIARNAASAAQLSIDFELADARTYRKSHAFDVVLNLFNSFGYFATEDENLALLACAYDSLVPGGKLLLETVNKDYMVTSPSMTLTRTAEGAVLNEETHVSPDKSVLFGRRTIIEPDHTRSDFDFSLQLYSEDELGHLLHRAGFSTSSSYGALDGRPLDSNSNHMIVLARKD
jgi:SAM-dependent methyltransferase